ncbi:MAG TPA: ABC transporter substrate binding protein [Vicinamibacteria bacterium]|nr:ABC transporter substrate binding protein [Vicinamibacteria bacterium]
MKTLGRAVVTFVLVALLPSALPAADIAVLKSSEVPAWWPAIDALRRSVPTHTVTEYDLRGDRAEGERVVAAIKGKAGLLVAMGPLAAQIGKDILPDLPLVYCLVQDPVRLGIPATAAGVAFQTPIKNQLAAFRLVYPRGVRIGVIFGDAGVAKLVEEAQKAAPVIRISVVARPVTSDKDVPATLRALLKGDDAVDALWIPPDPLLLGDETRRFLLTETLKAGKPVYTFNTAIVAEGALVSDGPNLVSVGELVGELVNRLGAGDRTARGTLLVPRAELVINKKIADRLKIEIPAEALAEASKTGKVF